MYVTRVLSNNAVVADRDGHEVVAMGPGIGFKRQRGEALAPEAVERVFVPSPAHPAERLAAFLAELPADHLDAAVAVCEAASARVGIPANQALVIAIADHLSFAVERHAQGLDIDFPLAWEIGQLYPQFLRAGRESLAIIEARLGVRLPADEAVSFAMHFINASSANGLSAPLATRQLTLISQLFDVIDTAFDVRVDRDSMSASRFVTHLRYVFARIDQHRQIEDTPSRLLDSITASYPAETYCAQRIMYLLQVGLRATITADETAFVALHVARLLADVRGTPGPPGHPADVSAR